MCSPSNTSLCYSIPYAKPPTGSLRWQKSEPAPAFQQPFPAMHGSHMWQSIAQAVCCVVCANPILLLFPPLCVTAHPPQQPPDAAGCPQDCKLPPHTCPPTQSEDCLFMNIFTPHPDALTAEEADTGVPVMVFIHGGNFKQV